MSKEVYCPSTGQVEGVRLHEGKCEACGSTAHLTLEVYSATRAEVIKLSAIERMEMAVELGKRAGVRGDSRMRLSPAMLSLIKGAEPEDRTPLVQVFNLAYERTAGK